MRSSHERQCLLCSNIATPAHVKTRGSGGGDVPSNICDLCWPHHEEQGKSIVKFAEKYPKYKEWLINNGWEICPVMKAWRKYESR